MATDSLKRWRDRLEGVLDWTVILLMAGLALLVVVAVAFRKFGGALVWYDEVASILLAWLTYYGSALAALKNAHIGFPRLVAGAAGTRRRVLLLIRTASVVVFFLITAWAGWRVVQVLSGDHLVSLPWVPTRLTQSVIPIGALLFVVAELLLLPARLRGFEPATEDA